MDQVIRNEHNIIFKKIDDSIYKIVKNRFGTVGTYVSGDFVAETMNQESSVALIDEKGKMYFSTHSKYGFA